MGKTKGGVENTGRREKQREEKCKGRKNGGKITKERKGSRENQREERKTKKAK